MKFHATETVVSLCHCIFAMVRLMSAQCMVKIFSEYLLAIHSGEKKKKMLINMSVATWEQQQACITYHIIFQKTK